MELFYRLSKVFWSVAAPSNLLVSWLAIGCLLLFYAHGGARHRMGRFMVGSGILLCTLIMIVPFGYWGLAMLEQHIPQPKSLPANVAGIIVLGGSESENIAAVRGTVYTSFPTMNRLVVFKMLADRYPQAELVYSGGTTRVDTHDHMRQADIAKRVMEVMQGERRKIIYERDSRTTFENARNSAHIIGDKRRQPWILVTSAWHMPRALGTFRKQGWNVVPMPADYSTEGLFKPVWQVDFMHNLVALQTLMREVFGLIGYYYAGQSDALLPEVK